MKINFKTGTLVSLLYPKNDNKPNKINNLKPFLVSIILKIIFHKLKVIEKYLKDIIKILH